MQKEIYMRVNGMKIKLMVMVFNRITKAVVTKETGKTINKMEKVLKSGLMAPYMKANISTE